MQNQIHGGKPATEEFSKMSLMQRDKIWREAQREVFLQRKKEKAEIHYKNEVLKLKAAKSQHKAHCRHLGKNPKKPKLIYSSELADQGKWIN